MGSIVTVADFIHLSSTRPAFCLPMQILCARVPPSSAALLVSAVLAIMVALVSNLIASMIFAAFPAGRTQAFCTLSPILLPVLV